MRKSIFKRMVTLLMAVMTMAIVFSFSAVSVSAAAVEPVAAVAMVDVADDNTDTVTMQAANLIARKIMPLTGAAGGAGGSGVSNTQADTTYKSVIDFFVKWITRIGWLVAFVGAIMFALAIKNNDAEQKQNGLMTMIAGFVAAAVCMAADMFNLFS